MVLSHMLMIMMTMILNNNETENSPEFLASNAKVQVQFPGLPVFLRSSGSGTGSTQPYEYN
jgi:hypothetical protein